MIRRFMGRRRRGWRGGREGREGRIDAARWFQKMAEDPALLPPRVRERFDTESPARVTADYIAGMTDRFAMEEHRKLQDPHDLS